VTAPSATHGRTGRGTPSMNAILIPAEPNRPVTLLLLPDTAAAFSAALGDVLLDAVPAMHAGQRCALYFADDTVTRPDNPRAAVLAARLGLHDRAVQACLRGDVLVTGLAPDRDDDQDVPELVVAIAVRHIGPLAGSTPSPTP
jgi:hypothetical protein